MTFKQSSLSLKMINDEDSSARSHLALSQSISLAKRSQSVGSRTKRYLRDSIRLKTLIGTKHNSSGKQTIQSLPSDITTIPSRPSSRLRSATSSFGSTSNEPVDFRRPKSKSVPQRFMSSFKVNSSRAKLTGQLSTLSLDANKRATTISASSLTGRKIIERSVTLDNDDLGAKSSFINIHKILQNSTSFAGFKSINSNCSFNSHNNNPLSPQISRSVLQFRLAKMSFYLILLWFVSWTPIATLAMLNSVIECYQASATTVLMANLMTKLGPAFDVFIYGLSHPKIKSRFRQIIELPFQHIPFS